MIINDKYKIIVYTSILIFVSLYYCYETYDLVLRPGGDTVEYYLINKLIKSKEYIAALQSQRGPLFPLLLFLSELSHIHYQSIAILFNFISAIFFVVANFIAFKRYSIAFFCVLFLMVIQPTLSFSVVLYTESILIGCILHFVSSIIIFGHSLYNNCGAKKFFFVLLYFFLASFSLILLKKFLFIFVCTYLLFMACLLWKSPTKSLLSIAVAAFVFSFALFVSSQNRAKLEIENVNAILFFERENTKKYIDDRYATCLKIQHNNFCDYIKKIHNDNSFFGLLVSNRKNFSWKYHVPRLLKKNNIKIFKKIYLSDTTGIFVLSRIIIRRYVTNFFRGDSSNIGYWLHPFPVLPIPLWFFISLGAIYVVILVFCFLWLSLKFLFSNLDKNIQQNFCIINPLILCTAMLFSFLAIGGGIEEGRTELPAWYLILISDFLFLEILLPFPKIGNYLKKTNLDQKKL